MREKQQDGSVAAQIKLLRKCLKVKIQEDNTTFRNHCQARNNVYELVKNTVVRGESDSALIIGPRGSGKTTLINSVLHQLSKETDLENDAIIVRLNGLVHYDEKVALKSITAQMQLENAVDGKVYGSFAEQVSFLVSCLTSTASRNSRSIVFLLEECDLFCRSGRVQTLLYNLFDITHSGNAPMCVLGITNRIDVMDLLEKRVKSRFSHRHIYIFPNEALGDRNPTYNPLENFKGLMVELLSVPMPKEVKRRNRKSASPDDRMEIDQIPPIPDEVLSHCKMTSKELTFKPNFVKDWNAHIKSLVASEKVTDAIEKFCYYTNNEQVFRNVLFQTISKLSPSKPHIDPLDVSSIIDSTVSPSMRVRQLQSLSVLELSLLIAMSRGSEQLDCQPLNFEMVLHRYQKFAQANSSSQSVPRPVILKAFEHLQELEIVIPARSHGEGTGGVQKEYVLHCLAASSIDIHTAVKTMKALPTEIVHWLENSIE